jgi:hypothetical protein
MDIEYLDCEEIELPELSSALMDSRTRSAQGVYFNWFADWRDRCDRQAADHR